MKKIKLKWAKSDVENKYNFGDDLGPYIINKLSGHEIEYIRFANSRINILKEFLLGVKGGKFSFQYLGSFINSFFASTYIISIGSIIQWYSSERCIVWGSGIISRAGKFKKSKFLAVRGVYTQAKLRELGFDSPKVIGDPALLLPIIYTPKLLKHYNIGLIPHVFHFIELKDKFKQENILVINLNSPDIENIIDEINSCDLLISTSLHGLIVSHAYNKKAIWCEFDNKKLSDDNVKFLDYFSSVEIPEYDPLMIELKGEINLRKFYQFSVEHENKCKANTSLKDIQQGLLSSAPFPILEQYLSKLN